MNINFFIEAVNCVDDDLIAEASVSAPKKNNDVYKYLAAAAAVAVVLIAAVSGIKYFNLPVNTGEGKTTNNVFSDTTETTENLYYGVGGNSETFVDGGNNYHGNISNSEVVIEGTGFTKEEIRNFVEEKKYELIGAVACEYENFDDIYRISTVGYCHVSLGETNVLKRDYVTLPISLGDKIIASITLFKSDGEMRYDIAVRGNSFDTLNKIFAENPESEIAFFYVDLFWDIAITPSNKIYSIHRHTTDSLDENFDYYGKFKTEYNTFSLAKLTDKNNYISVKPMYEENLANGNNYTEEIKEEASFQNNLVATTKVPEINISIDDLFSKEIVSVERGDSYMLMKNRPFEKCTNEQAEKIKGYISDMKLVIPEKTEMYYGGGYIAKLNYSDGTFAYVALKGGNQIYLQTDEGGSPIYVDTSGNAEALASYMISLI